MAADRIDVIYAGIGAALSCGAAAVAFLRSRAARGSSYAEGVYHMTERSHRRFAALSTAFGAGFLAASRWPGFVIPLLAVYTLLLVLYASSFARGFSGEDD
jgi:hypothetical protein